MNSIQQRCGTLVVTGASGFFGGFLVSYARANGFKVILIPGPRHGGIDLTDTDAHKALTEMLRQLKQGENLYFVHNAALVEWHSYKGFAANAQMAWNCLLACIAVGVEHAVLISGVNVSATTLQAEGSNDLRPETLYGLGKLAAENLWRIEGHNVRHTVLRLAGIWGWQTRPTLFWNNLLWCANGLTNDIPVLVRPHSKRNYISTYDAARCILFTLNAGITGTHLLAGLEAISLLEYAASLRELPESKLKTWKIQDESEAQDVVYPPSPSFTAILRLFDSNLRDLWLNRPPHSSRP